MTDSPKIKFGSEVTRTIMDNEGSTIQTEVFFKNGEQLNATIKTWNIKVRVNNSTEEMAEYLKFRDRTKSSIDPTFKIEQSARGNEKGFWYVVMSWSEEA